MAKVIVVKYKGSGKFVASVEGQKSKTFNELDTTVIPENKQGANVSEMAEIIANYYWKNVLDWSPVGFVLHQGQLKNGDYVHVIARNQIKLD